MTSVTSVTAPPAAGDLLAEAAAERVEAEVAELVGRGVDETALRRRAGSGGVTE